MPITSATAAASTRSAREVQYSSVSSSSQFFMNRPTTSKPCCLSSHAATDESTPPDMPTTTRSLRVIDAPSSFEGSLSALGKRKRQGTSRPLPSEWSDSALWARFLLRGRVDGLLLVLGRRQRL